MIYMCVCFIYMHIYKNLKVLMGTEREIKSALFPSQALLILEYFKFSEDRDCIDYKYFFKNKCMFTINFFFLKRASDASPFMLWDAMNMLPIILMFNDSMEILGHFRKRES